jgi:hypothetical protein
MGVVLLALSACLIGRAAAAHEIRPAYLQVA